MLKVGDELRIATEHHLGSLVLSRPAPIVALIRAEGHVGANALGPILELRDAIVEAHGRIYVFDDLSRLDSYDSVVRVRLTEWCRARRDVIDDFHVLARSGIVALGITVANGILGERIQVHARAEPFEHALRAAVRRSPAD